MSNKSSNRRNQPELKPLDFEVIEVPFLPAHMDRATMDGAIVVEFFDDDAIEVWLNEWERFYFANGVNRQYAKTVEMPLI